MFSKKFLTVFFIAVIIAVFIMRKNGILPSEDGVISFLKTYPISAPFLFILVYILMIIFLAPTLPMNLGAGFLWGGFWGGALTLIAAPLGAIAAFFIARYLAHDYFNQRFNNSVWRWLKEKIQKNNWKIIVFTRVNPIFPFGLTSYFFGLTKVPFLRFFLSTVIPIIPGIFLFAYLGQSVNGIILGQKENEIFRNIFIFSVLSALAVVLYYAAKKYFAAKKEKQFIS